MLKIKRLSAGLEIAALIGIDPASDGLARAARLGVEAHSGGLDGFMRAAAFDAVELFFDATSASSHRQHHEALIHEGRWLVDLTPAAIGPYVVPVVNVGSIGSKNVNMVTCGGQATIPIVAAIASVAQVPYAEIVASISSRSAGPGTRANIDEFTQTTARALEKVGGAVRAKAIIVLNPAEPPLLMRNTVFTLSTGAEETAIAEAIAAMVARVQTYVPGYRLKQEVQFERFGSNRPLRIPGYGEFTGLKTSVFIEVEGAAHYLPSYAGNLDIMTSAALAVGERIASLRSPAVH
jgi:acetaldehyde dehydrogenase